MLQSCLVIFVQVSSLCYRAGFACAAVGCHDAQKWVPRAAQDALKKFPKLPQTLPKSAQDAPKWLQDASKLAQDASKAPSGTPGCTQGTPQTCPRLTKAAQDTPRLLKDAPKTSPKLDF